MYIMYVCNLYAMHLMYIECYVLIRKVGIAFYVIVLYVSVHAC